MSENEREPCPGRILAKDGGGTVINCKCTMTKGHVGPHCDFGQAEDVWVTIMWGRIVPEGESDVPPTE